MYPLTTFSSVHASKSISNYTLCLISFCCENADDCKMTKQKYSVLFFFSRIFHFKLLTVSLVTLLIKVLIANLLVMMEFVLKLLIL